MSKVKIFCKNVHTHGKKVVIPFDGEIEVGEDGTAEVSQEAADCLVENGNHEHVEVKQASKTDDNKSADDKGSKKQDKPSKADKNAKKAAKEDEGAKEEGEESSEKEAEGTQTLTKEDLDGLELNELLELAVSAELKEDDYKKFKASKPLMINFLLKNLK